MVEYYRFQAYGEPTVLPVLPVLRNGATYAYDDLNRLIGTIYPDSDDTYSSGTFGNGADGIYDRVEVDYDKNSNVVEVTDQRSVVFTNTYDNANRLTVQAVSGTATPGSRRNEFSYDSLNRLTQATNEYSQISRSYDDLGRMDLGLIGIRGMSGGHSDFVVLDFLIAIMFAGTMIAVRWLLERYVL